MDRTQTGRIRGSWEIYQGNTVFIISLQTYDLTILHKTYDSIAPGWNPGRV